MVRPVPVWYSDGSSAFASKSGVAVYKDTENT